MKIFLFVLFFVFIMTACRKTNEATPNPQAYLHLSVTGVLPGTTWSLKIVDQTGKIDYNVVSQTVNQEMDISVNSKDVIMVTGSTIIKTFVPENFIENFSINGTSLKSSGITDNGTGTQRTFATNLSITIP